MVPWSRGKKHNKISSLAGPCVWYRDQSQVLSVRFTVLMIQCRVFNMARSESVEQAIVVARARNNYPDLLIYAIPNGGPRDMKTAVRLKSEGVLAGMPDIVIARKRREYGALYIEMKHQKQGALSKSQKDVHEALRREGYRVETCHGADAAWQTIQEYLNEE